MYWSNQALFGDRPMPAAEHVALVLHQLSTGGSERVAIRLANAWADAGRRVTLFCGQAEGPLAPLVSPQVEMVPVTQRGPVSRRELGRVLAGLVRRAAPDVVVGPGNYHVPILAGMQSALGADRPAVVSKISNPLRRADRSRLAQAAFSIGFRRLTRRFDALVAMSPAFAAEAAFVTGRHDIACIDEPNLDVMPVCPDVPATPSGTILCIGRLTRQKNFALALDAFARLRPSCRLVVLGEGEQEAALRAHADALGIASRIRFEGHVADVRPYLAQADALLCTSIYEGYPAVLIEALAAGVPIVSTPCSIALPEILTHESFGAVVGPHPADLAAVPEEGIDRRERPAAAPLAGLARRHRLGRSADAWLGLIDRTVAARLRVAA